MVKIQKRETRAESIFYFFNYLFLGLCAIITLFPFINVIATSLSSGRAIISREVFILPKEFNFEAYKALVKDGQLIFAMKNTVFITVFGTVINMAATILTAYSLSKKRLGGRKYIMSLMVFTMLFGGGLIPSFIIVKNLGLVDTYGALWLPGMISVYNMIILKTMFEGIPESLEEAASIDGASDVYILIRVVIPLSFPAIATLTLFYAVGWWNDYFNAMIYISDTRKLPLTVKLMQMISNVSDNLLRSGEGASFMEAALVPESIKSAAIIISTLPILCIYPFLQKYFVKGVMIGSVKG